MIYKKVSLALILLLICTFPLGATDQNLTFKVPPVKIPLNIKDQNVTLVAWALITIIPRDRGVKVLRLALTADLSDLQQNVTAILSSALDKDDQCGDRIDIQHASLTPVAPSSVAVVQLHYERWACVKLFGKRQSKKLVGGNAVMQLKLTPAVEANNTELRLIPDTGPIEADGSLGDLLRGPLGDTIREKIEASILSAMQRGTNLAATLPPAVQSYASIQNAQFKDAGSGRLLAILKGEVKVTDEQVQALSREVKERLAPR